MFWLLAGQRRAGDKTGFFLSLISWYYNQVFFSHDWQELLLKSVHCNISSLLLVVATLCLRCLLDTQVQIVQYVHQYLYDLVLHTLRYICNVFSCDVHCELFIHTLYIVNPSPRVFFIERHQMHLTQVG